MRRCTSGRWAKVNSTMRAMGLLSAAFLCAPLLGNIAVAQEGPSIHLNPIIINGSDNPLGPDKGYIARNTLTGTKTDTPLREIPQSVSIITRAQMDDRVSARVEDAIAYTAGVTASPWGADDRFTQFTIRGFDIGPYAVFRDGLPQRTLSFSGFKAEPYGLERVEILKGPASVLYGQNEPGGLVNLVTKRPTADPVYSGYAGYGSFSTYEVGIDAGGPLDKEGIWTYRLTGLFRDGKTQQDFSKNDRVFIAPAITWSPSADTSLTILGNYQWDELTPNTFLPVVNPQFGTLPEFSRSFTTSDPKFDRFNVNHGSIGYQFEHSFNTGWTVRQNLRYSGQNTDYRHLYYANMANDHTLNRAAFTVDERATIFSVDNSAQYDYESTYINNTLLLGFDHNRYSVDGRNGYDASSGYPLDIANPRYGISVAKPGTIVDRQQSIDQYGIYAQTQMKINDRWLLSLGGRQAWINDKTDNRLDGSTTRQSDNAFTGKAGIGYLFDNGLTPYLSYSESFITNIGQSAGGGPFAPSKGRQYEAGIKYEPDYFPGTITASAFEITKTNVLTPDPTNSNFQVQTGEVRHRGIELESMVNLFHGVSLIGSYTYLDAQITSSNAAAEMGKRPARVPEHQASLWAKYTFETGVLGGLSVGSGIRYVGDSFGDNANNIKVGDYTLIDAAVSYEKNGWKGALKASNLFDKKYYSTCDPDGIGSRCIYGEGRAIKLTLSASF